MEKTNFYAERINEKFNTRFVCDQDINWDYISSVIKDGADLMAYSDYLNWDIVSKSGRLWWIVSYYASFYVSNDKNNDMRYLNYFKDKINWDLFFKYTEAPLEDVMYLDPEFFEKYVNWDIVFKYQRHICDDDSRECLIDLAGEKADWKIISRYQNLDDRFILNNIEKLDLELILKYQILSTDVISELKSLDLIGDKEIKIILQNQPFFEISDKEISDLLGIKEEEVIEGMKENALRHVELIEDKCDNGNMIIKGLRLECEDRVPNFDDLLEVNREEHDSSKDRTKLFFTVDKNKGRSMFSPHSIKLFDLLTTESFYPIN